MTHTAKHSAEMNGFETVQDMFDFFMTDRSTKAISIFSHLRADAKKQFLRYCADEIDNETYTYYLNLMN